MIQFTLAFDYSLAGIIVALIVCATILIIFKLKARDSRTALAIELGELKSKIYHTDENAQRLRYRVDEVEKKLK